MANHWALHIGVFRCSLNLHWYRVKQGQRSLAELALGRAVTTTRGSRWCSATTTNPRSWRPASGPTKSGVDPWRNTTSTNLLSFHDWNRKNSQQIVGTVGWFFGWLVRSWFFNCPLHFGDSNDWRFDFAGKWASSIASAGTRATPFGRASLTPSPSSPTPPGT